MPTSLTNQTYVERLNPGGRESCALWSRILPPIICALAGLLIALWPHMVRTVDSGSRLYLSDSDELICYLPLISNAQFNSLWTLADVALPEGGQCLYPSVQFTPFANLAGILNLSPTDVLIVWRSWAGLAWGLSLYFLSRKFMPGRWMPVFVTLIILSSQGTIRGETVRHQALALKWILSGDGGFHADGWSTVMRHLRLITPGVSWIFLASFLWTLRVDGNLSKRQILISSALFGGLFYVYFYYWTSVFLMLVLLFVFQREQRMKWFSILAIGTSLGIPGLLTSSLMRSTSADGWLERVDFMVRIGRLEEIHLPPIETLLSAIAIVMIVLRHRELGHFGALLISASLLRNHQVLTGLQMQNDHYGFVIGPILAWITWVILARELLRIPRLQNWVGYAFATVAMGFLATGLYIRTWHVRNNSEAQSCTQQVEDLLSKNLPNLGRNPVVAGMPHLVNPLVSLSSARALTGFNVLSHSVSTVDWELRRILELTLLGRDPESAAQLSDKYFGSVFSYRRRSPEERRNVMHWRTETAKRISRNLDMYLRLYEVQFLIAEERWAPPEAIRSSWKPMWKSDKVHIWSRAD